MTSNSNQYPGIIDTARNPFVGSCNDWIEQRYPLTQHRRDQAEKLLHKTVEEIRREARDSGRYPAFVAIRWGYAEIRDDKLVPTAKWDKWQPPDRKKTRSRRQSDDGEA